MPANIEADPMAAFHKRFGRRPVAPEAAAVDSDAALMALAKLLTGLGGEIPDAEMRSLERFLDGQ